MNENCFYPGGTLYGSQSNDFEFDGWPELYRAMTTDGHPLQKYQSWINAQRRRIKPNAHIRVSFDLEPPIVEEVWPKDLTNFLYYRLLPLLVLAAIVAIVL